MTLATRRWGGRGGKQRHLQRGVPLLVGVVALALVIGMFPSALHTVVSGPGTQAGAAAQTGVPPLGLAKWGTGDGALGTGGAAGSRNGAGIGAGAGGLPTPGPVLPPRAPICPGKLACPTAPPLSIRCHDGVPGTPASHTTEDPLSPPCVVWDLTPGKDDPSHGIYSDHIDVVLLGIDSGTTVSSSAMQYVCRADPRDPSVKSRASFYWDWYVFCHYLMNTFQTYGRTVVLYTYQQTELEVNNLQLLADDLYKGSFHPGNPNPPFAILGGQDPEANRYVAKYEIEQFEFGGSVTGHVGNGFSDHYFDAFLNSDWTQGGSMNNGVPFFWPFNPSVETTLSDGAAWVCQSLAVRPAANSDDPNLKGKPRKIALGYETTESEERTGYATRRQYYDAVKALANRFALEADQLCGHPVFDEFGTDPSTGAPVRSLRVEDDLTFTYPGEPELATEAIGCMQHKLINPQCPNNPASLEPDTTLVCLLCQNMDQLGTAEQNASYFPEYTFISGGVSDPWLFRADSTGHFYYGSNYQKGFNNAFGIRELWQLPGWDHTYWYRAWRTVDPTTTVSYQGTEIYEELMQLFAAIQLGGPDPTPAHVASGDTTRGSSFVGLYGWQRVFGFDAAGPVLPPASPAAGYSLADHAFLKGMEEERWDPSGTIPGPHFDTGSAGSAGFTGCFRIIDNLHRLAGEADLGHRLIRFSSARYDETEGIPPSTTPLPPCTGDDI